jgi:hypothetical protein
MTGSLARSFATGLVAASLVLGASLSSQAKTIEFPADKPVFTFKLPKGWTTETGKDGRIYCTAGDGSEFKFGIVESPSVKNEEGAKELLSEILKSMSDAMECKEYKTKEPKSGKTDDISLVAMEGSCKAGGTEMSLNAVVFSLTPGKYFSMVGAASKEVDKAHEEDMNGIIGSIAAVD